MELRDLRTFAAVARLLSFHRAAAELNAAQSTVSARIAALETELGVRLFERLGRRVALTDAGERLVQYAANLGAQYMTLEVRRSNTMAQNLYKSMGFVELAVRKRYYEDNGEDALLLVCDHMPPVEADFTEE